MVAPSVYGSSLKDVASEPVIRLENVSLQRRTQEELSYDLKRTLFKLLEGRYRRPKRQLVLDNVALTACKGEKIGIIGANGSGKSTLLKLVCGILEPSAGRIFVRGRIAPLIELEAGFDRDLTLIDNIIFYGVLLGYSRQEMRARIPTILEFSELQDYANYPLKGLSSGMIARLGFAIATDINPDILLLDEVLAVGDERFKQKCQQRIEKLWSPEMTVFLVSHDLEVIRESCQRALVLDRGRVRYCGETETAIERYLGAISAD